MTAAAAPAQGAGRRESGWSAAPAPSGWSPAAARSRCCRAARRCGALCCSRVPGADARRWGSLGLACCCATTSGFGTAWSLRVDHFVGPMVTAVGLALVLVALWVLLVPRRDAALAGDHRRDREQARPSSGATAPAPSTTSPCATTRPGSWSRRPSSRYAVRPGCASSRRTRSARRTSGSAPGPSSSGTSSAGLVARRARRGGEDWLPVYEAVGAALGLPW